MMRHVYMRHVYETLDIDGISIVDAIAALQAWNDEHQDVVETRLGFGWDGDDPYFEVGYQRPMTPEELNEYNSGIISAAEYNEQYERETYERLKAKYEGK